MKLESKTGKTEDIIDRGKFLECLLSAIGCRYNQLKNKGQQNLHAEYIQNVFLMGEEVDYILNDELKQGILQEIKPQGEIVILDRANRLEKYHYGEIQLKI